MVKRIFTYCFVLFITGNLFSQRDKIENLPNFDNKKIHYGFYLGLNKNSYKISYNASRFENPDIETDADIGFNVGLIGDLKLHKNINLRFEPGLISNTKTLSFNHLKDEETNIERQIGNTFLHLPVIFKFSTDRLNNIRPYVLAGVSYNYNFSSNEKNTDDNLSGEFRQNANMLMYEVGIGMDFYLPYFKFSPSIRGLFAINNEIKYDNTASQWTDPINYFGTRGVFIHLAFE